MIYLLGVPAAVVFVLVAVAVTRNRCTLGWHRWQILQPTANQRNIIDVLADFGTEYKRRSWGNETLQIKFGDLKVKRRQHCTRVCHRCGRVQDRMSMYLAKMQHARMVTEAFLLDDVPQPGPLLSTEIEKLGKSVKNLDSYDLWQVDARLKELESRAGVSND